MAGRSLACLTMRLLYQDDGIASPRVVREELRKRKKGSTKESLLIAWLLFQNLARKLLDLLPLLPPPADVVVQGSNM